MKNITEIVNEKFSRGQRVEIKGIMFLVAHVGTADGVIILEAIGGGDVAMDSSINSS